MRYDKVIIKQIPDSNPTAINLEKYNRSRFPGCVDTFQASLLQDGRYITGLDDNARDILSLSKEDREEKQAEIRSLRENLEQLLNVNLKPTSEFWETFKIAISTDQPLTLNKSNPSDIIKYHVLVANGYVAPTKDAIGQPEYLAANYYAHVDEVENKDKVSTQKVRDRAKSELVRASDNKDLMLLWGKFLEGTKYKSNMSSDTLYSMLSDFIDDRKNPQNLDNFLKVVKLPIDELQYKVTVETAIRKKIIKFKDGHYFRGGVNLGRTASDVLRNLSLPDYANEFVQINDEVNSK